MIKSHNDYLCKNPVIDAMDQGAGLFECDVIYSGGEIMVAHSWRPACLCKMSFAQYCNELIYWTVQRNKPLVYLQIEIKDGDMSMVDDLCKEIEALSQKISVVILPTAINRWYHFGRRLKVLEEILLKSEYCERYEFIENTITIETRDFY